MLPSPAADFLPGNQPVGLKPETGHLEQHSYGSPQGTPGARKEEEESALMGAVPRQGRAGGGGGGMGGVATPTEVAEDQEKQRRLPADRGTPVR